MTNEELVKQILEKMGGRDNVLTATNCMTRLRITVKDNGKVDEEALKAVEDVMGVVHDRPEYYEVVVGPGKCRKCADICQEMGIPSAVVGDANRPGKILTAVREANRLARGI